MIGKLSRVAPESTLNQPDEPTPTKKAPKPAPSRLEEARRVIEQYTNDLREIIAKLRQRLH
jgi:hypothetical protein